VIPATSRLRSIAAARLTGVHVAIQEFHNGNEVFVGEATEDRFTGMIERQTGPVPSSLFLAGSRLNAVSATLKLAKPDNWPRPTRISSA